MEVQKRLHYTDILNHLYCHIWSISHFKFRVQLIHRRPISIVWNKPGPKSIWKLCLALKWSCWGNRKKKCLKVNKGNVICKKQFVAFIRFGWQKTDLSCQFQHSLSHINVTIHYWSPKGKSVVDLQVTQGQHPWWMLVELCVSCSRLFQPTFEHFTNRGLGPL